MKPSVGRHYLQNGELTKLFREELGWDQDGITLTAKGSVSTQRKAKEGVSILPPSFGDGIYAMVRLAPGTHTITASALDVRDPADPDDDFATAATYTIVVE